MDEPMVWVISPDPETRRLIELNLSKRGFRAFERFSLDEPVSPDVQLRLIILDVDSPDDSGWTVVSGLRESPYGREVPLILLMTAAPTASQLTTFQPARWVEKPLAMDTLLAVIRESLDRATVGEADSQEEDRIRKEVKIHGR